MASYETKMIFAQNLSRLLNANDMDQIDLANKIGVAASSVSNWCTGEKMPRMDKIEWIASFFGVPVTHLIERYDPSKHDALDEVDVAFYAEYKELDDTDRETIRDMVHLMYQRKTKKSEYAALPQAVHAEDPVPVDDTHQILRVAARDGSFTEYALTDEQAADLAAYLDQLSDVPDDL